MSKPNTLDLPDQLEPGEATRRLKELLRTAPPALQNWGTQRTREYKEVALKARKLVDAKSMRKDFLNKALRELKVFYV